MNFEEQCLKDEFNLKLVYPADLFYKTHRISQKDFLQKLRDAAADDPKSKKVKKLLNSLYKDDSVCGRRGVKPLKESNEIVKRKIATKAKHRKFA